EEESAFSLGFCKLRFPRSGRNGGQEHFFNKLLGVPHARCERGAFCFPVIENPSSKILANYP
ncbi:MAG: hypothetical protein ACYC92_09345, partial [Candidatus Acidiferrales bacterium]